MSRSVSSRLIRSLALSLLLAGCGSSAIAQTVQPAPPVRQQPPQSGNPPATYIPDNGDNVIVGFPKGQTRAPVVTGPVWNGGQQPPTQNAPAQNPPTKASPVQKPPAQTSPSKPKPTP